MRKYVVLLLSSLPAVLALTGIVRFFAGRFPYDIVGDNLVPCGDFDGPVAGATNDPRTAREAVASTWKGWNDMVVWAEHGGVNRSAALALSASPEQKSRLEFAIPDIERHGPTLLVCAAVRSLRARADPNNRWWNANVRFGLKDGQGQFRWTRFPLSIAQASGTTDWHRFYRTFEVPPNAVSGLLLIQHRGVAGTLWVDDLAVLPVRLSAAFLQWRSAMLAVWIAVACAYVWFLKIWRRPFGSLMLLVTAVIIGAATCPERIFHRLDAALRGAARPAAIGAGDVRLAFAGAGPAPRPFVGSGGASDAPESLFSVFQREDPAENLKNRGHLVCFAILAGLAFASAFGFTRRAPSGPEQRGTFFTAVANLVTLSLFAWSTEVLQMFTSSRTATFADFMTDELGIASGLAGFLACRLVLRVAGPREQEAADRF